jgi:hypothetical protein
VFADEYVAAFRTHDDTEPIQPDRLTPFYMILLMPDLVLAVGRSFEKFELTKINSRPDAGLDPETLWRIPDDVNVAPVPPPSREIRSSDKVILNERRAGNRGKPNRPRAGQLIPKPL